MRQQRQKQKHAQRVVRRWPVQAGAAALCALSRALNHSIVSEREVNEAKPMRVRGADLQRYVVQLNADDNSQLQNGGIRRESDGSRAREIVGERQPIRPQLIESRPKACERQVCAAARSAPIRDDCSKPSVGALAMSS